MQTYAEFMEQAWLCAHYARTSRHRRVAEELWMTAQEYQRRAADLNGGIAPDIREPEAVADSIVSSRADASDRVKMCLARAENCRARAHYAANESVKTEFLKLAAHWQEISKQIERIERQEKSMGDAARVGR